MAGAADRPPECGEGKAETRVCGLSDRGTRARPCATGVSGVFSACDDPDQCTDRTLRTIACSRNGRGTDIEACEHGAWVADHVCDDPDVCDDRDAQTAACGPAVKQGQAVNSPPRHASRTSG